MRRKDWGLLLGGLALAGAAQAQFDAALLDLAQKHKASLVEELGKFVAMDSGTDNAEGLSQVETILAQRLSDLGALVEVMPSPPAAQRQR